MNIAEICALRHKLNVLICQFTWLGSRRLRVRSPLSDVRFLGAKCAWRAHNEFLSACPHISAQEALNGFRWNLLYTW